MSNKLIYPKPLRKNSTIGLICPAGGFVDYKPVGLVVNYLHKLGYKVKLGKSIITPANSYKYLSGSDENRLLDLHSFFCDNTIDAIFCLRGGYGSLRIVEDIDYKLIKKNKKLFLGFSDITILLLAFYSKAGLVTFHGPLLGIDFLNRKLNPKNKKSANNMWKLLRESRYKFSYSNRSSGYVIYPGKCSGPLLGGNLTDICAMLGSRLLPSFKNSILFLEDCYEEPYRIDRLLMQLKNAGIFKEVSGLVFSGFYNCKFKSKNQIVSLLKDKISDCNIPAIFDFPIGHDLKNYTVPIGVNVTLDADRIALYSV